MSTRSYQVSTKGTSSISVTLAAPIVEAENLYLQTWASSFVLANLLHKLDFDGTLASPSKIDVLEIGAGTGLVGISSTRILEQQQQQKHEEENRKITVVLTDLPTIVPSLVQNIQLNTHLFQSPQTQVLCGTLDWKARNELFLNDNDEIITPEKEESKPTLILAADTMYTEDHPELVSETIFTWLRKTPSARAVVCYSMRIAYLDAMREFWERMEAGGLICVQEGREELGEGMRGKEKEEWDDEKLHEWCVWKWNI